MREVIPIIDVFAGPGGLGEGFSSYRADSNRLTRTFRILLSVEKNRWAHQTLELRSFFRQFSRSEVPSDYYRYLRGEITREALFVAFPVQANFARLEAVHAELGKDDTRIFRRIRTYLRRAHTPHWVLVGGPPCQAYSVAGRSRMGEAIETDARQVLYQQYLKIIARFRPSVFVMENVKGLLSSRARLDENARPHSRGKEEQIFHRILRDLKNPTGAVQEGGEQQDGNGNEENTVCMLPKTYRIYSLVTEATDPTLLQPTDFLLRSEEYGIPQTRHRVILLGVREDLPYAPETLTPYPRLHNEQPAERKGEVSIERVIADLPKLRSQLSRRPDQPRDSAENWSAALREILDVPWLQELVACPRKPSPQLRLFEEALEKDQSENLRCGIRAAVDQICADAGTGGRHIPCVPCPSYRSDWYCDERIGGVCNHESRGHMRSDLHRYLFLACYAHTFGVSPTISELPTDLIPNHANLAERGAGAEDIFDDRFRVQAAGRPATTITSHIAKDGHYNVHYDPRQCRSLTVREAARIQTFPDNYFFEGPRTEQYHQVGNAVPPLLAYQIAGVVYRLLEKVHEDT